MYIHLTQYIFHFGRESEEECDTSRISFDDSLQRFIEGNWGMSSDFVSYNECRRFLSIEVRSFTPFRF